VNDRGQVDFRGLAKSPGDLKAFVDYIARVSPESDPALFPGAETRLAYHINAYNALAMYNVIDSGIPRSLSGFTKLRFFRRLSAAQPQPDRVRKPIRARNNSGRLQSGVCRLRLGRRYFGSCSRRVRRKMESGKSSSASLIVVGVFHRRDGEPSLVIHNA